MIIELNLMMLYSNMNRKGHPFFSDYDKLYFYSSYGSRVFIGNMMVMKVMKFLLCFLL